MRGDVSVTDNISSVTVTNLKNNVDVQLTWTPSCTDKNQLHIDYVFSINNTENKTLYQQAPHSSWGVEYASYKFDTPGIIVPKVTIDAILFQPVEPVVYNFKMSVKV